MASSSIGVDEIERIANATRKEMLIIREEFNKVREGFVLVKQFKESDSYQLIQNDPWRQKETEDGLQYWLQCLERRFDEIMNKIQAIDNTMIELQKEFDKTMKTHEEHELKKGVEEILQGLQGMKVI